MDSVLQTMVNEKIGPGERAKTLVQNFCEEIKATTGAAYRTYPDCLISALKAVGVKNGSCVAVSPLSPKIYEEVIKSIGAQMILVDIDKETGCPNDCLVAQSGADVLLLFEPYGTIPVKYNSETTFPESCDYSSVKVIEDISQSIGSKIKDDFYAGQIGNVVVCAMEDDNVVSAGGGAVLAVRGDAVNALRGNRPSKYIAMPDMNAALGTVQLANLTENCNRRREILKTYQQGLSKTRHKQFGVNLIDFMSNAAYFVVQLESRSDEIIKFANKHDVPVMMAFEDCILKNFEEDPFEQAPVAATYFFRAVQFPLYMFLKNSEIDGISKVVSHLP